MVSYTYVKETTTSSPWDTATYYSYDISGNVDTLLQDYKTSAMANAGNRFKKIVYDFSSSQCLRHGALRKGAGIHSFIFLVFLYLHCIHHFLSITFLFKKSIVASYTFTKF